jgi:OOP family OmpA-OmpF porin
MGRQEPNGPAESKIPESTSEKDRHAIDTLRDLIAGPELAALEQRLDDPVIRAREMGQVLPEALRRSAESGDQVSKVLRPSIEASIKSSVRKNPKAIVDAIFPVMGPALRKAIAATIMGMVQSLNHIINHSFSMRGIKWRIEALRTKTSFAEVVLLNTLVYQVEQIFLIHKETGLVLQHVVAAGAISQDPDLVSAMLTAIQNFVSDSFETGQGESLDTLRMGTNLSVWIEQGPQATLAAAIRGTPPMDLRGQLQDILEHIHLHCAKDLESFEGDTADFDHLRDSLEDCLSLRVKKEHTKISPLVWIILVAMVAALCFWAFQWLDSHRKWRSLVNNLNATPGIVVTMTDREDGKWIIKGLRDPLSENVEAIIKKSALPLERVVAHWEGYHALAPDLILKRAEKFLEPPTAVRLELSGKRLIARGFAPHAWINKALFTASAIPGIGSIDTKDLVDMDKVRFEELRQRIEAKIIYFEKQEIEFASNQEESLTDLVKSVLAVQEFQSILGRKISLMIFGHTDTSGKRVANLRLSRERATQVQLFLIQKGCDPAGMVTVGVGDQALVVSAEIGADADINRSVTFRVNDSF